jgi:hypothetical protein
VSVANEVCITTGTPFSFFLVACALQHGQL